MSNDMPMVNERRALMHSVLQRIATGPELSKNISRDEARVVMSAILDQDVDPVQAGVFLIALRMKRETDEENLGLLDAMQAVVHSSVAAVDDVLDVSDPYNGFNRNLPVAPFLPAVLAACGLPALSHGVARVAPKNGATHALTLRAAGALTGCTAATAAARLADPAIGWAYVDQSQYAPKLHALVGLRDLIVKRPAITTLEVMAGPVRGRRCTHLMTGYVHKPYSRVYALLAREAGFGSALLVRGIEGGVVPSLSQRGKIWQYRDFGEEFETEIMPAQCGIERTERAVALPDDIEGYRRKTDSGDSAVDAAAIAAAAARTGLKALHGAPGPARDSLIYAAALALWHCGRSSDLEAAAATVRQALDSGEAGRRFAAGC